MVAGVEGAATRVDGMITKLLGAMENAEKKPILNLFA
jgi:hypothetical protein